MVATSLVAAVVIGPIATAGPAWSASGGIPGTGTSYFNPAADSESNHCLGPSGEDLNTIFDVSEQLVVPGECDVVDTGEFYIPFGAHFWYTNTSFETVPAGYTPAAATPMEDFVSKVVSVTYVIDGGTANQKTFRFRADDIIRVYTTPDGYPLAGLPIAFFFAKLPPLPPGDHTYDAITEMSARSCDGLGTSPLNCIEGNTSICDGPQLFRVVPKGLYAFKWGAELGDAELRVHQ